AEVEVSIEKTPSTIEGKVSSSKDSCKSNVVVRLFWKSGGVWQNVARDETTDAGRYKISGPGGNVPPGKYYSLVKAKAGCDRAKSETIRVGSVG
ncbi:MAG: hypothetical protein M3Y34_00190, partial [Actinomycetota bacterium]|nr:hypothetical protein [Actinomycetota bacterium]